MSLLDSLVIGWIPQDELWEKEIKFRKKNRNTEAQEQIYGMLGELDQKKRE